MQAKRMGMQILAVLSQKGGAGKTTLSVHLAVSASRRGLNAAILDTDPQQSACFWYKTRGKQSPVVLAVQANRVDEAIVQARDSGVELIIVDTAPNAGPDAVDVAGRATKIMIPVRPSILDLSAAKRTVSIVRNAGVPAFFVLSACPYRAPEVKMARESLSLTGFDVSDVEIGDRRAFSRAFQTGQAAVEFEPDGKAANEIEQLLDEILN